MSKKRIRKKFRECRLCGINEKLADLIDYIKEGIKTRLCGTCYEETR